jgi:hypothetical protein
MNTTAASNRVRTECVIACLGKVLQVIILSLMEVQSKYCQGWKNETIIIGAPCRLVRSMGGGKAVATVRKGGKVGGKSVKDKKKKSKSALALADAVGDRAVAALAKKRKGRQDEEDELGDKEGVEKEEEEEEGDEERGREGEEEKGRAEKQGA